MKGYLIRQHERCIEVLDAIERVQKKERKKFRQL